ncbi:MAG TPA: COX15/CtaA family protein [Anaerolineales bacterium]|nr:COX15/CtaA family protein [Anaerolineales bacterium]
MNKRQNFTRYAWFLVFYNVVVILWGAVVRATGSGAGCGRHWPTCNGTVVPLNASVNTLIEFSHRITSALDGLLVIFLLVWAILLFRKGLVQRRVRNAAIGSLVFILVEGGLGAGLVLLELVEDNATVMRAFAVGIHLINTFILLTWLTLTAWWSTNICNPNAANTRSRWFGWLVFGAVAVAAVGSSGAITALGDTLFPPETFLHGLRQDFMEGMHFLVRLRVYHPVIAILTSAFIWVIVSIVPSRYPKEKTLHRWGGYLQMIIGTQIIAGGLNVLLLAPTWLQLLHLFLADALLIMLVVYAAELLAADQPTPA